MQSSPSGITTRSAEKDLKILLKSMNPSLLPGTYAFVSLPKGKEIPPGLSPLMVYQEPEGITLILSETELSKSGLAHAFFCRGISLNISSSLYAIGFLAKVSEALAKAAMSINIVSAFHRDYIFVPTARADEAVLVLKTLAMNS
jgi:uncharacterized protein